MSPYDRPCPVCKVNAGNYCTDGKLGRKEPCPERHGPEMPGLYERVTLLESQYKAMLVRLSELEPAVHNRFVCTKSECAAVTVLAKPVSVSPACAFCGTFPMVASVVVNQ